MPWQAASSYPLVPLIWPARNRRAIFFQSALQLRRVNGVVFDGVAGTQHLGPLEAGNGGDDCQLHVDGQGRAHAIDVDLVRLQALRFQIKLVRFLIGKLDDLVLDRGAIASPDAVDLSAVHRRAVHVIADDAVSFRRGVSDVAWHLLLRNLAGAEAERSGIPVARLGGETRPIDGASVQTRGGSGFEAAAAQSKRLDELA